MRVAENREETDVLEEEEALASRPIGGMARPS